MTSKYEASVEHAMVSWHQALQPDCPGDGVGRTSVSIQRRELMDTVISEKQEEGRVCCVFSLLFQKTLASNDSFM